VVAWASLARGVLVLANTPKSVFSPVPIFALSLFFLYSHPFSPDSASFSACVTGVAFSLLSVWASNIWNHVNDVEEDRAAGKDNPLTRGVVNLKIAMVLALAFYVLSMVVIGFGYAVERTPAIFMALTFCVTTFLYSWSRFNPIGGRRLKEHWAGEALVYAISIPTHTLVIALVYTDLDIRTLIIAVPVFAYLSVGLLLKDLKDISADIDAGHRTLGTAFSAKSLIRGACVSLLAFYIGATVIAAAGVVGIGGILVMVPAAVFIIGVLIPLKRRAWVLTVKDGTRVRLLSMSTYLAFAVWGLFSVLG